MEVRVLGPLEVVVGGVSIPIGGGRQRKLLAILLLHANEFVSSDRLIDELWGEDRPGTAAKALQGYVSQLRKTLGPEMLVTGPGSYMLELAPGQLDADRFEQLVDDARDAEPHDAAEWLREALALWRGPPLADFTYDEFAQGEIARFEERRLVALERRIEADLALGRDAEVAGELASLVRQHPLRERLRAELMLALYRSGRQAEALEAFADARRTLRDELGLEPSQELRQLQAAILVQDPQLGPSPRTAWPRARRIVSRPRFVGALGAILLLAAVGAAALVILGDSGEPALARAEPDSVAFLDSSTGQLLGQVPARRTALLRFGGGFLWSMSVDGALEKIDPTSRKVVRTIGVGVHPGGLAYGERSVWVTDADSPTLLRIDPRYGSVERIKLPAAGGGAGGLSVGAGSVWVVQGGSRVLRIDPETSRVEHRWRVPEASDVHFADGKPWLVSNGDGVMSWVDPATNEIIDSVKLRSSACCTAVGGESVWMESGSDPTVWKFSGHANPATPLASVKLAGAGGALAYGNGALWATTGSAGTVTRIDPRTHATKTFTVGHEAGAIAVGGGRLAVGVGPTAADSTAGLGGRVAHFISIHDWFFDTDPAVATDPWQWQLEYATCAKLMNHPDARAPAGWRVVPEAAAARPTVSADGRTYSFRVRRGFRFSPPSNEPVTAETFRYTIERALSPRLGPKAVAAAFVSDIAGVPAYRAGRSRHVSGLDVRGDRLTIALTKPAADLPSRMALPYFCAVPNGTPIVKNGLTEPIHAAGPYYLAEHIQDVVAVLKRNPNYGGARPQRLDAIVFRRPNVTKADAISEVEQGKADHIAEFDANSPDLLHANGPYADRYGPSGLDGTPRFLVAPTLAIDYLAFNARSPLFADARVRRAVNFALDRRAMADTYGWLPADHYLPPAMPGYHESHLYPLEGPDLERARALARDRGGRAVLHVCEDAPSCTQWARIIRGNLAAIGIDVAVRASRDPLARAGAEGADMLLTRTSATFPSSYQDPVTFLENALALPLSRTPLRQAARAGWCSFCGMPPGWFPGGRFERKLERIRQLGGREREAAAGALDFEIARAAPGAVLMSETYTQLFSARMGCQKFQPLYHGVDIAALCLREDE
jgi:DNA-binding SARP family transcriptional activator/ABC-type transport system substrate-binding protein